ncbi:FAD-dependent oxidoreductase [Serinibacter arcticus]|uniref:Salicylate hydroxylase n=1 Tax=Serinibacter arcticus TaxID=1655435 RepID=A0A4Z1E216_9MICO|nr:NAD(P)/FAD-dependent oxidoreductase [Serinibacter arcticus]TGO04722.1 Salicylate hydroxylase [Serinibacter arcticus]
MRDVLVVGGGAVGLALASTLAASGLDVVVWERRAAPEAVPGRAAAGTARPGHSRAIGLHAPALEVLHPDVAAHLTREAVQVVRGVARTRERVLGVVPFDRVSRRFPFVATLPQVRTQEVLHAHAATVPGLELVHGRALVGLHGSPGHVVARAEDGGVEHARFVVAADGARSGVRDLLGVPAPVHPYPDTYVMGDLADSTHAGSDAIIHLEHAGVVESFPLPGGLRRWVVHTGTGRGGKPTVSGASDAPTAENLASLIEQRTGIAVDPGTCSMLSAFTVRRRLAARTVHGRVVLLGDAAHEISPIGGQGMNLGWLDGARLAPVLLASVRGTADDAATRVALRRYDDARRRRARWAARQAELNMGLGRPVAGTAATVRDGVLRALLGSPARRGLASVYAMRHLR